MNANNFTTTSPGSPDEAVSTGTIIRIAAIVSLVVAFVISIIVLICCCRYRKKTKKLEEKAKNEAAKSRETKSIPAKTLPKSGIHSKKPVGRKLARNRPSVGTHQVRREKKPETSLKPFTTPLPLLDKLTSAPPSAPVVKDPLPKIEETQPDDLKSQSQTAVTKPSRTDMSSATEAVVTVVEKQYVCFDNGVWQTVDRVDSQFSFYLDSGRTFSEDS